MEDTTIYPGEYVYSFRVDLDYNNENLITATEVFLLGWFPRLLIAFENKKDTTPHLQGCLWRDQKISNKDRTTIKNFFTSKAMGVPSKGGFHLFGARKVESLSAYCNNKEQKGGIVKNVDINRIKDWKNPKARMEILKDTCIEWLKLYVEHRKSITFTEQKNLSTSEIVSVCLPHIQRLEIRPPPIKTLYYWAMLAEAMNLQSLGQAFYDIQVSEDALEFSVNPMAEPEPTNIFSKKTI